ncbi:hypothetical protein AB0E01_35190 [Nocardia vinacea]|uniref:hypothetical protein n=1 Tax=Nocardia vinacea TaxID=96468 RepID=UPI0033E131CC
MVEVNRPDRQARRLRGKSDPLDAESAARRLSAATQHVLPKDSATVVESIRVLRVARAGAVTARSAALNQLEDIDTASAGLAWRLGRPPAMTAEQIRQARAILTRPEETVSSVARLLGVTVYKYLPELSDTAAGSIPPPTRRRHSRGQRQATTRILACSRGSVRSRSIRSPAPTSPSPTAQACHRIQRAVSARCGYWFN